MKRAKIRRIGRIAFTISLALGMSFAAVPVSAEDPGPLETAVSEEQAALPARKAAASGREVETRLTLSGPESGDVAYVGDTVVFTAKLTDLDGNGIANKRIKLTTYIEGTRNSSSTYYETTNDDGITEFKVSDLEEGAYLVYAGFEGDASEWGGSIYEGAEDTEAYALTVKPASERPQGSEEDTGSGHGANQIPTTVAVTEITKDDYMSTSSIKVYKFKIAAYDDQGNPVNEDTEGVANVRLHIIDDAGKDHGEQLHLDPEGKYNDVGKGSKSIRLVSGTYEVYAEYIGKGQYASAESPHYTLKIAENGDVDSVSEKSAPDKQDTGDNQESQTPTTTSVVIRRDGDSSRWFYITATVKDQDGNAVYEETPGYDNLELYLNGTRVKTDDLTQDGDRSFLYSIPENGEYDIYAKYIGRGHYAGSESWHIPLTVNENTYTTVPVEAGTAGDEENEHNSQPGETGGETTPDGQPSDDDTTGDDEQQAEQGNPPEEEQPAAGGQLQEGSGPQAGEQQPTAPQKSASESEQISRQSGTPGSEKTASQPAPVAEASGAAAQAAEHTVSPEDPVPETGDHSAAGLWLVLLIAGDVALFSAAAYRRKIR